MKRNKAGAPDGNKNAAKAATERLPWRMPSRWGIRQEIERRAKAKKQKPIVVLRELFGTRQEKP